MPEAARTKKARYIERVCRNNDLLDTVVKYVGADGSPTYIDRHVDPPPGPRSWACEASLALVQKWQVQIAIMPKGVRFTGPILIVDDSWLTGAESAPPPHVMIFAKRGADIWESPLDSGLNGVVLDVDDCPFGELILEKIGRTQLVYRPYEPDWERGGLWTIPPVPSRVVDGRFIVVTK